jgi:hypothetical protein
MGSQKSNHPQIPVLCHHVKGGVEWHFAALSVAALRLPPAILCQPFRLKPRNPIRQQLDGAVFSPAFFKSESQTGVEAARVAATSDVAEHSGHAPDAAANPAGSRQAS